MAPEISSLKDGMRRIATVCAVFFLVLLAARTEAADISVLQKSADSGASVNLVIFVGEIRRGDAERFDKAVADLSHGNTVVVLEGPGGKLIDGLSIGTTIRLRGYDTVVLDGSTCASACGLIWLAGRDRYVGDTARIGFHAVYERNGGEAQVSGAGNALVGSYLNKLGLSDEAVLYITEPNPDQNLHWLSQSIATRVGIRYIPLSESASRWPFLPSPSIAMANPPAAPPFPSPHTPVPADPTPVIAPPVVAPPAAEPTISPVPSAPAQNAPEPAPPASAPDLTKDLAIGTVAERQVMRMIVHYYAQWSMPGADLSGLAQYYAPTVNFYGGDIPRQKVLAEKQKFLTRWPVRQFTVQTIAATCQDICSITGTVTWDVGSEARNERSLGSASFRFNVAVDTKQTPPRGSITLEAGSVTQAHKEALHSPNLATTATTTSDGQAASVTAAFSQGRQDRIAYETWYAGLPDSPYHDGAAFWAAHRSDRVSPTCGQPGMPQEWQRGCMDARARLSVSDLRRKIDKSYWWGWNSL